MPVCNEDNAYKSIRYVECDSLDDFYDKAEGLWEKTAYDTISANVSNDFDGGDSDIGAISEKGLEFYAK
mgnify:CR=1 FL=1